MPSSISDDSLLYYVRSGAHLGKNHFKLSSLASPPPPRHFFFWKLYHTCQSIASFYLVQDSACNRISFKHCSFAFHISLFYQLPRKEMKQLHVKTHLCCYENGSLYPQVSCFMNRSPGSVRFFSKKKCPDCESAPS